MDTVVDPSKTYVKFKRGDGKEELISVETLARIAAASEVPKHSKKAAKFTNAPINLSNNPVLTNKKSSVLVNAKAGTNNSELAIYISVVDVEVDGAVQKKYAVTRNRAGAADQQFNFGFDKSYSYHAGEGSGKEKWYKKNIPFTSGGIHAKRWVLLVPVDAHQTLIEGLKVNFPGATLVESLDNEEVRSVL